jgi:hypothetical protein
VQNRVFSLAFHFSGRESLAADITQDVFVKLLTRIRPFRREAEFAPCSIASSRTLQSTIVAPPTTSAIIK